MAGRDPAKVSAAFLAYYAICEGDEPLDYVGRFVEDARPKLGELLARGQLDQADGDLLGEIHLFFVALEQAAIGTAAYRLDFKRSRRGKPADRLAVANRGNRAAAAVERLVADGWKQEAALAQVSSESGLVRSEIFSWLGHRRRLAERLARHPKPPK